MNRKQIQTDDLNKQEKRKVVKEKLALGELENEIVTVEVEEQAAIHV